MLQPKFNILIAPPSTQVGVLTFFFDGSHLLEIILIIFQNCLRKYYLIDSAYPNTIRNLALYIEKETHCHALQFNKYGPPERLKKQFNHQYLSLRMATRIIFGVLKER